MDNFETLLQGFRDDVANIMELLKAGKLTVPEWEEEFAKLIAMYHQSALMLGLGRAELTLAEMLYIISIVEAQLEYLSGFALVVQSTPDFIDGWLARADLYAKAIKEPYWKGNVDMLPLPAMPAQGTICLCITTPESRVLTRRGEIPIRDVVSGDEVFTHKMRWRKVLSTPRNKPNGHRQAWVKSQNGATVGCTDTHRFLTPNGWQSIISIDSNDNTIYNISYEYVQNLQSKTWEQKQVGGLRSVPRQIVLSMREAKGLSGGGMSFLRKREESARAMGEDARKNAGRNQDGGRSAAHQIFRLIGRWYELGQEIRWEILHKILGWAEKAIHLPLSTCLDTGERAYSGWNGDSPQEQRCNRRPDRESGINRSECPSFFTHDARTEKSNGEWQREGLLPRQDPDGQGELDMPEMWEEISGIPQDCWKAPEILLEGVLPQEVILYDLEVEEDHSFFIEGLCAHNSNCKCAWDIRTLDETAGDYDAYWIRAAEDSCPTCLQREADWSPVRIRGGNLVL